jgi:nucleoside-diphosphate-sugar epimerase
MNAPIEPVFLTGGTGFLGSHLRKSLAAEDVEVTLLVRPGSLVTPRATESVLRGDVTDPETLSVEGHETVVHLAARTSVGGAIESPGDTWSIDATGTLNILEAARHANVGRVLYASTSSVYGKPTYLPIDEDHPTNPREPYGASKLAGDRLAHAYHHAYDLPVSVGRVFNTFGPDQPEHNVVPAIVSQALSGTEIELGNLSPSRDFLYVADTVDALRTLLAAGEPGEVYNVGSGEDVTIGDLASRVVESVGGGIEVVSTADRQRDSGVEIPRHVADASKLRALGWRPDYSLDEGLAETIESIRS